MYEDCEYAPTADRDRCYEANRAAALERARKMQEREAAARAAREAVSPAEAVQIAAGMLRGVIATDWDRIDGAALSSLSEASAYLAVAARKLAA